MRFQRFFFVLAIADLTVTRAIGAEATSDLTAFSDDLQAELQQGNVIIAAREIDEGSSSTLLKVRYLVEFRNEGTLSILRESRVGSTLGESRFTEVREAAGGDVIDPETSCLADNMEAFYSRELQYVGILGSETLMFFGYPDRQWHAYDFATGICSSSSLD